MVCPTLHTIWVLMRRLAVSDITFLREPRYRGKKRSPVRGLGGGGGLCLAQFQYGSRAGSWQ